MSGYKPEIKLSQAQNYSKFDFVKFKFWDGVTLNLNAD